MNAVEISDLIDIRNAPQNPREELMCKRLEELEDDLAVTTRELADQIAQ